MRKVVEHMDRLTFRSIAQKMGYPTVPLELSLLSYTWPRHPTIRKAAGEPIFPARGIAAGSAWAVFELALCMWEAAVKFKCSYPEVVISFHVDDTPLESEDVCPDRLAIG